MALTATVRKSAERATMELPFRIPPQEWFTLQAAAKVIGISESAVEKLYDQGQLSGHSHNAGAGLRQHKRILRVWLISYMIRTADYCDDSLFDAFAGCLRFFSRDMLLRLIALAQKLVSEKPIETSKKFSLNAPGNFPRAGGGN